MVHKTKSHRKRHRKTRKGGTTVKPVGPPVEPVAKPKSIKTRKTVKSVKTKCANENTPCNLLDTQYTGKLNETWKTCIDMNGIFNHIVYITPKNVLIKSIDTVQIPEFVVKINNKPVNSKIMIEDKYITCLLYICGNWYAIMRLFGITLNTGVLARTEKNRAFFKLNNIHIDVDTNNPNNGSGVITIPENQATTTNKKQFFATSNTPIIQLKPESFTNINKQSIVNNHYVFYVLQEFRLQKLIGNSGKYGFIGNVAEEMVQ